MLNAIINQGGGMNYPKTAHGLLVEDQAETMNEVDLAKMEEFDGLSVAEINKICEEKYR